MNTKTDWIKMTDRQPTKQDLPVWAIWQGDNAATLIRWLPSTCTHWRPAKDDIPAPPSEEAQEESDYAALVEWGRDENIQPLFTVRKTWHAALAWERAEVAKMLPPALDQNLETMRQTFDRIEAIRARCAGGGNP